MPTKYKVIDKDKKEVIAVGLTLAEARKIIKDAPVKTGIHVVPESVNNETFYREYGSSNG